MPYYTLYKTFSINFCSIFINEHEHTCKTRRSLPIRHIAQFVQKFGIIGRIISILAGIS